MGMALLDLVNKLRLLKGKLSLFEQLKAHAEMMRDESNSEALDEVLLDLDEFCVGPLQEEIAKIEKAEVNIDGKAKKGKGKAKAANQKDKRSRGAKRTRSSKGG